MNKTYLFIYSDIIGDRDLVKKYLESMNEVIHWRYDMPNCFYIKSNSSAQELTEALVSRLGDDKRFLFAEISENKQGYLPKATWEFLNS